MTSLVNLRVYFNVALYPEDTFNRPEPEDDDEEYELMDDFYEKFDTHLVTDTNAPHVIKTFTEKCQWDKDKFDEYLTKLSYDGDGRFIADIHFKNWSITEEEDEFLIQETVKDYLFPGDQMTVYIDINNKSYELDVEIDGIHKLNKNGEEVGIYDSDKEEEDDEINEEDGEEEGVVIHPEIQVNKNQVVEEEEYDDDDEE